MHRFIVVGGGAGGLELATRLGDRFGSNDSKTPPKAQITLVDRYPTHIWKPLLHEVAAGSMDPFTQELEYAAQALWHGFEFQQGELIGLNRARKTITISALRDEEAGEILPERELEYDTLVLAIGSTTHFFGVEGAQQHSIALDTVHQANLFRKRLIAACMRAEHFAPEPVAVGITEDEPGIDHVPRIQVAIVGAGATGVELSAELRNTVQVLSAYGLHKFDPKHDIGTVLIEARPRILPVLQERMSTATAELLTKLGVKLMTGEKIAHVGSDSIRTARKKTFART